MKIFSLAIQAVALSVAATSTASAFQVGVIPSHPSSTSSLHMSSFHLNSDPDSLSQYCNEPILKALGNMEGPSICYGHFAKTEGKNELDIKEYDNFDRFKTLVEQTGCASLIQGNGPFTVFAPTNSALDRFDGVFDEETIKTHIIPRDLYSDELEGSFETLSGHTVVCKKQFRKTYVDEAIIGQLDTHTGGTPFPTNAVCENGVIHAINTVLKPGWSAATADSQGVQGLSLQSHLNQEVLKDRGSLPDSAKSQH
ncbi:MAG: hypothetical protein SGILL_002283 [Bacillariaceae sp.]